MATRPLAQTLPIRSAYEASASFLGAGLAVGFIMLMRVFLSPLRLYRGDIVEVLSEAEIAATLDASGCLEGLPFMPEMARHCGQKFRVFRRAEKTCVEGQGLRRMRNTVFLEDLRCDGAAHDGCQRDCLIFWKEAWLKRVAPHSGTCAERIEVPVAKPISLWGKRLATRNGDLYFCQSTALTSATQSMAGWNPAVYMWEILNGELSPRQFFQIASRAMLNKLRAAFKLREVDGLAGTSKRNPKGDLLLASGETVKVKSAAEIAATLDPRGRNCGLSFEPDMAEFVGQRHEVAVPVTKIILEESGRMGKLTNTVALKGVTCRGLCSKNCPRSNPIFWREIWLDRESAEPGTGTGAVVPIEVTAHG